MNSILIVDDENEIVELIDQFLMRYGFKTFKAYSGKTALKIVENQKIDLLLTDIMMPGVNGLELIKAIRTGPQKDLPIIVLTGQATKEDISDIIRLGINDFIEKPYERKVLIKTIQRVLREPNKNLGDNFIYKQENEFLKIALNELLKTTVASQDIYMQISDSKFLLFIRNGEEISPTKIEKLKNKNVKHLYVKHSEHKSILKSYLSNLTDEENLSQKKEKLQMLKAINELILEEIYSENFDKEIFEYSLEVSKLNTELIINNDIFFNLFNELENYSIYTYKHSVGVSLVSNMISKNYGWHSNEILQTLTMASIYHDIGKKWINKEILNKPFNDFSENDWEEYKKHPTLGAEILSNISNIPDDMIPAILHHHEYLNGEGYSMGLNTLKITPLASILSIANDFCNLTLKNELNPYYSTQETLEKMKAQVDRYDNIIFNSFLKIFK